MRTLWKASVAVTMLAASSLPTPAYASFDPSRPGWTEVINCPTSSFTNLWGNPSSQWGTRGQYSWNDTGSGWWTYAQPNVPSTNCAPWRNGSLVGGATYSPGSASVPQGVNVSVYTYWNDYNQPGDYTIQSRCGHQHAATYVWGWRYFGNSWGFEFVNAHMITTCWNAATQHCDSQAQGNPCYTGVPAFAFGPEVIQINNSPYAVLYTKSQATSHYSAGCGQFECFHEILTIVAYN